DTDHRVLVGGEHLLDLPVSDRRAGGGAPVPGHHHASAVGERDDRGGVRGAHRGLWSRPTPGEQVRGVGAQEVHERGAARGGERSRQPVRVALRRCGHCPPFCTKPRTTLSAFVSSTSSISSSNESTSELCACGAAGGGGAGSSSGLGSGWRCSCCR